MTYTLLCDIAHHSIRTNRHSVGLPFNMGDWLSSLTVADKFLYVSYGPVHTCRLYPNQWSPFRIVLGALVLLVIVAVGIRACVLSRREV